jgi:hypothetical protein
MKAPFLCLALAGLPALGEHQEISLAPIDLYMQFQQPRRLRSPMRSRPKSIPS